MKRGEVIKGLTALGILTLIPVVSFSGKEENFNLHFVALGNGGTNAMAYIHQKGIKANYTCITGQHLPQLETEFNHIFWETPSEYRILGENYMMPLSLTLKMKVIFSGDETFIILTGLGSSVGTGFIKSLLDFLNAEKKNYLAICSLPFKNEGWSKLEYANQKKTEIVGFANVLFLDHQAIEEEFALIPIKEKFEKGNELFYKLYIENNNIQT
jgi:cell division GTPase FtsZ